MTPYQSALLPASPQAHSLATLWWWMLAVGGLVWLIVVIAMLYASYARGGEIGADGLYQVSETTHRGMERTVIGVGVVTVAILVAFLVYDFGVGRALAQHPNKALTIEVIGHQWWWEVHYVDPDPSKIVVDANEIHVPVGVPVQFKLSANDVIHSFWVPNLNGKRDLVPGYTSSIWFTADTAGLYRGQCAEYCGMQHAKMAFYVIAEPKQRFESWLVQQRTAAVAPSDTLTQHGRQVFLSGSCAMCHTIGGTYAQARNGPDLTHFASRRTIGAGSVPNTRGYLAGWVVDPQSIKPGSHMPSNQIAPTDLQALLAYLESLR